MWATKVQARIAQPTVYQSSRTCLAGPSAPLHPESPIPQPLVAGEMLTYPGDPRGNPPQHVALSSFSTSAAPFAVDGPHPPGPTQPNPSFAVSAAPSLNAAGGWGDPSLMEAPARFMAPEAASAPSLGYTGNAFTRYQLQLLLPSEFVIGRCGNVLAPVTCLRFMPRICLFI
jgi:hypothetical protein